MSLAILDVHNNILLLFKKFQPKSQNNLQKYLWFSKFIWYCNVWYQVYIFSESNSITQLIDSECQMCVYILLLFGRLIKNSFFLLLFPVLMHQSVTDPEIRIRIRWLEKVALTSPPPILLKPELQQPQPEIQIPWPKKVDFGSNESEQAALMKEEEGEA